ncbi:MAG: hypothetical protein P4N59_07515 [Negativicutes bacterium]|nr:hypothetical protein [Negativicutes bacterium]
MVQGQPVNPEAKLVPYNTRIDAETKEILRALVRIQELSGGQRELISKMLKAYEQKNPEDVAKARKIANLFSSQPF